MIPVQPLSQHGRHLPQPPVDGRALRTVCGNFATGVTVITTGGPEDGAATTVNSFTSVSLDPPLVLFCLHRQSRLRPVLQKARGFVVNFLTRDQAGLAWKFAGRESARLADVPYHHSAHGLPVLTEALAFLECRLAEEYDGGDHAILVGEVTALGTSSEEADPLVFFQGAMRVLDRDVPAHARG
ncbi:MULTISPECIES: flavin reductase family protein [Streptomyces]|uniref:Pyrimidine utilization flavin reductase F n=1 Tax=Streptomyces sviceus (strain ATCC 29083 / DSM 924 / JCM 4929 / NBRC 13980 / NCIMB 11184 / NRRL 5439 / UC 5370) TaxID=463191 RepID=B5HT22_STRX2|nr:MULTISPECIES: flavin reductase family protein [Streptomyces]EDY55977.1 pyrimidine utilization flavin reductase F [Streptomyces sviceus ATCC 29083]MYT08953.1 flavin reductase [Streptomyces sp. SID5470]